MKKWLALLLIAAMLLNLCACGKPSTPGGDPGVNNGTPSSSDSGNTDLDEDVAQLICGTWYPDPQVSEDTIEIRSDGTCNYHGEEHSFQISSHTESEIVIEVSNGAWLYFLVESPAFTVLADPSYGACISNGDLWPLAGRWYCPETGQDFVLDFLEVPYWGHALEVGHNYMSVNVMDGEEPIYQVSISMEGTPVAEVLDVMNNKTLLFSYTGAVGNTGNCNHNYIEISVQPGTCQQNGSKTLQCEYCGHQQQTITGPGEHSYVNSVCQYCNAPKALAELSFTLNAEGNGYIVGNGTDWNEATLEIPATYNGLPIVAIGDNAFKGNTTLKQIVIPESVLTIGEHAFDGCSALAKVNIPKGLTSLGKGAFQLCTSLTEVHLPNTLTTIPSEMFSQTFGRCSSLTKVVLPENLTVIPSYLFYYCTALKEVNIPSGVTSIESSAFSGCSALTRITLPEGIQRLGDASFSACTALEQINLPTSLTRIGIVAMQGCSQLTVTIPSDNVSLGDAPFSGCKEIKVAPGVTNYQVKGNCLIYTPLRTLLCVGREYNLPTDSSITAYGSKCFYECEMTSFVIPDHITSIGASIFIGCQNLKSVTLPKNIQEIPDYLLSNLPMESFTVPSTVKRIGDGAFSNCKNLKNIVIPNSVTSIGEDAFTGCTSLTSIVIPDSVTVLKDRTFSGCTALKDVHLPSNMTEIYYAFQKCTALESIVLPANLKKLDSTFYGCTSLKSIVIPEGVTYIGDNTFRDCTSLETVIIPDSVTKMGDSVFMQSSKLKHVQLPAGLTAIPSLTFSWCEGLETLVVPGTVTAVGTHAFVKCNKLKTVYFGGTPAQWSQITLHGDYNEPFKAAQVVYP